MRMGRRGCSSAYILRVITLGFFYNKWRAVRSIRQGKEFVIFANVFKPIGRVGKLVRHCRKGVKIVNAFG